jgi:hypothetical protein
MGTSYSFDGEITIMPPLNFAQIRQAQDIAMNMLRPGFDKKNAKPEHVFEGYMPLKFVLETSEKDTDEGILKITRATGLTASHPGSGSLSYNMYDLVHKLAQAFPEHHFSGAIVALREDSSKAYKVTARPGQNGPSRVTETEGQAYIHWDDQSDTTPVSDLV